MSKEKRAPLCHVENFDDFLVLENHKLKGRFSGITQDFIDLFQKVTNSTEVINGPHHFGEPDEFGNYSGCIGRLQRNESDVLFYTADYPLNADNIDEGLLLFDTVIVFTQDYYVKKAHKDGQIFDSLESLYDIVHLIVSFMLLMTFLLKLRQSVTLKLKIEIKKLLSRTGRTPRFRKGYFFYYVVAHSTRNGEIPGENSFTRQIYLICSFFSLIILHYYGTSIKTSLVVIDEPELWHSYKDLMDKGILPFFLSGMNTEVYFKNAPVNSTRWKVWDYATKNFDYSNLLPSPSLATFPPVGVSMMRRQSSLIIDSIMMPTVRVAACNFKARNVDSYYKPLMYKDRKGKKKDNLLEIARKYMYYSMADPSEKPIQKGIIMSKFFRGKQADYIKRKFLESTEKGIQFAKIRAVQGIDFYDKVDQFEDIRKNSKYSGLVRDCMSESIVRPDVEYVDDIEMINVLKLIYVCLVLLGFCFITLFLESKGINILKARKKFAKKIKHNLC